jgi:hypothetical protein
LTRIARRITAGGDNAKLSVAIVSVSPGIGWRGRIDVRKLVVAFAMWGAPFHGPWVSRDGSDGMAPGPRDRRLHTTAEPIFVAAASRYPLPKSLMAATLWRLSAHPRRVEPSCFLSEPSSEI